MRTLIVTGFLAKDSEIEILPSGNKIFKAVMASNEYGDEKNPDGTNKAVWVNISSFKEDTLRKQQYLKKGSNVIVIGDMKTRVYQNKNGEYSCGIEVSNADVKFNIGSSKKEDSHTSYPDEAAQAKSSSKKDNEDIPIINGPSIQPPKVSLSSDVNDDDLPF